VPQIRERYFELKARFLNLIKGEAKAYCGFIAKDIYESARRGRPFTLSTFQEAARNQIEHALELLPATERNEVLEAYGKGMGIIEDALGKKLNGLKRP